jgi:hypothetical protein
MNPYNITHAGDGPGGLGWIMHANVWNNPERDDSDWEHRQTAHYRVINDITINGEWEPIWNFKGSFDGNGKTITYGPDITLINVNVYFPSPGLFSLISHGTVKDLTIRGDLNVNRLYNVGGLVGEIDFGTLSNITVNLNITAHIPDDHANGLRVGGIAALSLGTTTIRDCSYTGNITATIDTYPNLRVGGIVGQANGGTIINNVVYNSSVTSKFKGADISTDVHRIVGVNADDHTPRYDFNLANNRALSTMAINDAVIPVENTGAGTYDGANF